MKAAPADQKASRWTVPLEAGRQSCVPRFYVAGGYDRKIYETFNIQSDGQFRRFRRLLPKEQQLITGSGVADCKGKAREHFADASFNGLW